MPSDNRIPGISLRADEEVVAIAKPHWIVLVSIADIFILPLLVKFLRWKNTVYVLTTQRIIAQEGVISAAQSSVQLDKIQDAKFVQIGILGRIMGVGTVEVQTGGSASTIDMYAIPQPRQMCDRIQSEISAAKKREMMANAMEMAKAMKAGVPAV
jgi:uncharacterized membrane protein YdbT with pleckstrin-like domain